MPRRDVWSGALLLLGILNLGNAVWMLLDPQGWYYGLPAAVPHTGPLNEHFVRDIGCAFAVCGAALLAAAWQARLRVPLVGVATLFYLLHAAVHVWDTLSGRLSTAHWAIDLPGVYLPTALLLVVFAVLARAARTESS